MSEMPVIDIDAKNWLTPDDLHVALLSALHAPEWHGHGIGALTESMVWGEITEIDPPYLIRLHGAAKLPQEVIDYIDLFKKALADSRDDFLERRGYPVDALFEIVD